ncbi:MAG: hypothetical protein Q4P20_09985 [Eubacteriales bacterium]|nr:hypothetical protein [Eubacteriales bacterium]
MKYRIKAPNNKYDRTLNGVRFSNGVAEMDNAWMAQWFSGRNGFTVETVPDEQTETAVDSSAETAPAKKTCVRKSE